MVDKANRKEKLIAAAQSGDFLDTVYKSDLAEPDEHEDLPLEIAALHNDGHINVVAEFAKLGNTPGSGPDFFTMRRVFEKTLPHIDAPMRNVMHCVLHLYQGAGRARARTWQPKQYLIAMSLIVKKTRRDRWKRCRSLRASTISLRIRFRQRLQRDHE